MHPAVVIVLWAAGVVVIHRLPMPWLVGLALALTLIAALYAGQRGARLFMRARWLFLTIAALFLWTTPGEFLPGLMGRLGFTHEGLALALGHLGYLAAVLSSLAIVHERLGQSGLIAGLYRLAGPLPIRDALAVRLHLVLDALEEKKERSWREWLAPSDEEGAPESLRVCAKPLSAFDRALIAACLFLALVAVGMQW
ncbi:MAG: hypothetical protein N2441_09170 [Rhodocyclaceae bacterium]|nr:hypothetical protein [Rhodocyclaceae bacterium]